MNGIFRDLQDKEFFDSKADLSPFWRAFHRERRRRGSAVAGSKGDVFPQRAAVLPVKNHVPVSSPKASLQGTLIDKNDKNAPVGGKYMRNGKYFAVDLAGEEVEIPPGFDFIRNKLRRIEFEPEKEEDDDALSFKDYPEYIQTALLESEKNGTITEDAEKNRKLVADWKKQRKTKTRKESQENEA